MEIGIAIIAAIAGAFFSYLAQKYFATISEDVAFINDHIEEMKVVEELSVKYWSSSNNSESQQEEILASKILGAFTSTSCFNKVAERILGEFYEEYQALDTKIYDVATGGAFQASDRKIECDKVTEIMSLCSEMRALLRKSRRVRYWQNG